MSEPLVAEEQSSTRGRTFDYGGTRSNSESAIDAVRHEEPTTGYMEELRLLLAILWPSGDYIVLACLGAVTSTVIAQRSLHILIPRQEGAVVDRLNDGDPVFWSSGLWLLLLLLLHVIQIIQESALVPLRQFSEKQMVELIHGHSMSLDLEFHVNQQSGELQKAAELGQTVPSILEYVVIDCIPEVFDLVSSLVFIAVLFGFRITVVVLCICVLAMWMTRMTAKWIKEPQRRYNDHFYATFHLQIEAINHWETVAQCNQVSQECKRFSDSIGQCQVSERVFLWMWQAGELAHGTVLLVGTQVAYSMAIYDVKFHAVPLGHFIILVSLLARAQQQISRVTKAFRKISQQLTDLERLRRLMKTKPKVIDESDAKPLCAASGDVRFDGVNFTYPGGLQLLDNITFEAKAGQRVALVGPSGQGKSTIVKLLGRFFDVSSGSIRIDGQDIRKVKLDDLRKCISWVSQDTPPFNMSIRANLTYGQPAAEQEELDEACRAAAVYSKIQALPDKYETIVGPNGIKLSGGEKQRLAIARLLVNSTSRTRPPFIVLDEATSALDTETEQIVQTSLKTRLQGRTCFIIAHRLSTIEDADLILVVQHGRIVESGTHSELLGKGGKYCTLWRGQSGSP